MKYEIIELLYANKERRKYSQTNLRALYTGHGHGITTYRFIQKPNMLSFVPETRKARL